MQLSVIKNKANGQIFINIPKSVAELYKIDNATKIFIEPKGKDELIMKIKRQQ